MICIYRSAIRQIREVSLVSNARLARATIKCVIREFARGLINVN